MWNCIPSAVKIEAEQEYILGAELWRRMLIGQRLRHALKHLSCQAGYLIAILSAAPPKFPFVIFSLTCITYKYKHNSLLPPPSLNLCNHFDRSHRRILKVGQCNNANLNNFFFCLYKVLITVHYLQSLHFQSYIFPNNQKTGF